METHERKVALGMCFGVCGGVRVCTCEWDSVDVYGVAMINRLFKIIRLFFKRAL